MAEPVLINSVRVDLEDPQQTHQPVVRFKYESVELFSTRSLLNLEGRYVKISTFNYYPYSSYEEVVSWIERVVNKLQSEPVTDFQLLASWAVVVRVDEVEEQ